MCYLLFLVNSLFLPAQAKKIQKTTMMEKTIEPTLEKQELKFSYATFDQAKKEKNYVKFIGSSTKFKMITTEFEGYAKEFTLTYEKKGATLSNLQITLESKQIDTDNNSRNEKMYQKCLLVEKYPLITAKLTTSISLINGAEGVVEVILRIKEKDLLRKLQYSMRDNSGTFEIQFKTDFSFVEAEIEDPSIFIAKVHELFLIEGHLHIK
jgi:polyisoprenoid-binding protein YceI